MENREHSDSLFSKDKEKERRNFKTVAAIGAIALVAVGGVVSYNIYTDNQRDIAVASDNLMKLSDDEISSSKLFATDFIQSTGSFGSDLSAINSGSFENIGYIIATDSDSAKSYYTSRSENYLKNRDEKKVSRSGELYYSNDFVSANLTKATIEKQTFYNYKITSLNIDKLSEGYSIKNGDINTKAVDVTVSFTSDITRFIATGTGTDWDGTIEKQVSKASDTITLTLVQDNNLWSVFSMEDSKQKDLLSVWKYPTNQDLSSRNFTVVDSFKVEVKNSNSSPSSSPSAKSTKTASPSSKPSVSSTPRSTAAATSIPTDQGNDVAYPPELTKLLEENNE